MSYKQKETGNTKLRALQNVKLVTKRTANIQSPTLPFFPSWAKEIPCFQKQLQSAETLLRLKQSHLDIRICVEANNLPFIHAKFHSSGSNSLTST